MNTVRRKVDLRDVDPRVARRSPVNQVEAPGGLVGPVGVPDGGTGVVSYATGDMLYASGADTLARLAAAPVRRRLVSGVLPQWSADIDLERARSGTIEGVFYRQGVPFLHDYTHGNNGVVTTAGFNVFLGEDAGNFTAGAGATQVNHASDNVGIGRLSLRSLTNGYSNVAIGSETIHDLTVGIFNMVIGFRAGRSLVGGSYNLAIGAEALRAGTSVNAAVALGYNALRDGNGNGNVGVGEFTLAAVSAAAWNVAVGSNAGHYRGFYAGLNTGSSTSVFLGGWCQPAGAADSNTIVVGYEAVGLGSNTATYGNRSIVRSQMRGDLEVTGNLGAGNGELLGIRAATELVTIADAAFTDTAMTVPAGALLLAVTVRVTVTIPTATAFDVGDAGVTDRFSTAAVSASAGATDRGTKAGAYFLAAATAIRITPDATPADTTGRVRVTVYYIEATAPTS